MHFLFRHGSHTIHQDFPFFLSPQIQFNGGKICIVVQDTFLSNQLQLVMKCHLAGPVMVKRFGIKVKEHKTKYCKKK